MILEALQKVFRNSRLTLLAIAVAVAVFLFAVWLPNLGLIKTILFDNSVPVGVKVNLPIQLIGSISTNFTVLSALYTIAIAVLFGMYIAMLIHFLKSRTRRSCYRIPGCYEWSLGSGVCHMRFISSYQPFSCRCIRCTHILSAW